MYTVKTRESGFFVYKGTVETEMLDEFKNPRINKQTVTKGNDQSSLTTKPLKKQDSKVSSNSKKPLMKHQSQDSNKKSKLDSETRSTDKPASVRSKKAGEKKRKDDGKKFGGFFRCITRILRRSLGELIPYFFLILFTARQTIMNQISTIRTNMEDDLAIAKEEISQKIGPIRNFTNHQEDHPEVSEESTGQIHAVSETTLSPRISDEVSDTVSY